MNKLSTLALVTALAVAPTAAYAASLGVGVNAGAGGSASAATDATRTNLATDANASVSASGQLTYDQLVDTVKTPDASATISVIGSVSSTSHITIVPVSDLKGAANADASLFTSADASARLDKVRAAVKANAALEAALQAKGYSDADVVDVQSAGSGDIFVYVAKQA